jgi:hypothetical protein
MNKSGMIRIQIGTHNRSTYTNVSEVHTASITRAMMMEAVGTSETSVYFKETTRRYTPKGYRLQQ